MKAAKLSKPYRIDDGKGFRLKDWDPADTNGLDPDLKAESQDLLTKGVKRLGELQDTLYAQDLWSVLLVFQAMDAAGKDSTIKHVMSGVNPQGCQVTSFKQPSAEELQHDFLWRAVRALPPRGHIGIFNRSYYEEVLVVRVHKNLLDEEKIPPKLVTKKLWKERFRDINAFEDYLARNGTIVRKFFLNVSQKEQKKRFLERLDEPEKNWKFSASDVREREYWDSYQDAYEDMIRHTSQESAPWYVVPADHKWFARLVVSAAIVDALESLNMSYPKVGAKERSDLEQAKQQLLQEKNS